MIIDFAAIDFLSFSSQEILDMKRLLFNPLPTDKILDQSQLKAFADDDLDVAQNIKLVFHRVQNIKEKDGNAP